MVYLYILGLIVIAAVALILKKAFFNTATLSITDIAAKEARYNTLEQQNAQLIVELKDVNNQLTGTHMEIARLQTSLQFKDEKLTQQKDDLENIGAKIENQFKLLANSILESKATAFNEQQEHSLKNILDPLKQHMQHFKQDIETKFGKETEERISLREQIGHMMSLNKQLADQANNLTNALKGEVKQQGNWGEMILESMLEYAGLQKNIQYFTQERGRNEAGDIIQPDIIVRYPDKRTIIIDSKVSLLHYDQYCGADNEEIKKQSLALMLRSLKSHVDGLSAKSYHHIEDALDAVFMFVPIEGAYITAMQADKSLWQYAYTKRIIFISPTNLITAMKLISDMWQKDAINKDAHKLAEKVARLYDKLVGFIENLEKVGAQIDKAQAIYKDAYKQLYTGKGNLISAAEQLRQINTTKTLPENLIAEAQIAENTAESLSDKPL